MLKLSQVQYVQLSLRQSSNLQYETKMTTTQTRQDTAQFGGRDSTGDVDLQSAYPLGVAWFTLQQKPRRHQPSAFFRRVCLCVREDS